MDEKKTLSEVKRVTRPKRYNFRTSEKIFDMLVDLSNDYGKCINECLELLIYKEYWTLKRYQRSQIELGDA